MNPKLSPGRRNRESSAARIAVIPPHVSAKRIQAQLFAAPGIGAITPIIGDPADFGPSEKCASANGFADAEQKFHTISLEGCVARSGSGLDTPGRTALNLDQAGTIGKRGVA